MGSGKQGRNEGSRNRVNGREAGGNCWKWEWGDR